MWWARQREERGLSGHELFLPSRVLEWPAAESHVTTGPRPSLQAATWKIKSDFGLQILFNTCNSFSLVLNLGEGRWKETFYPQWMSLLAAATQGSFPVPHADLLIRTYQADSI